MTKEELGFVRRKTRAPDERAERVVSVADVRTCLPLRDECSIFAHLLRVSLLLLPAHDAEIDCPL